MKPEAALHTFLLALAVSALLWAAIMAFLIWVIFR
jgi:hypothetical protein